VKAGDKLASSGIHHSFFKHDAKGNKVMSRGQCSRVNEKGDLIATQSGQVQVFEMPKGSKSEVNAPSKEIEIIPLTSTRV